MGRHLLSICLLLSLIFFSSPSLHGQGTDLGSIRGVVTDPSGAIVPGATVVVTDVGTGLSRQLTTDEKGAYEATALRSGNYVVKVTMSGFSEAQVTGIRVAGSGDSPRADVRLQPAGTQQSVVITAEAPVIHTEDQTISQTLTTQAIVELPRDSRDIYTFLYLNPNVTQGAADGEFKFIGSQSYGANFTLDGQRTNGGIFGDHTQSRPSLEAVGEFNVLSNDFSAEYAGIANIRIQTKRGGNEYHGSAVYNNKNSALAAWTLQDKIGQATFVPSFAQSSYPNPYFNENVIGGSFGGKVPVVPKTYFFTAYEKQYNASPVQVRSTNLPHPALWSGDFSRLNDSAKPAVPADITLTAAEIANNTVGGLGKQFITIPQRLLNPTTQSFIKQYFPAASPNAPINAANGRLPAYFNLLPGMSTIDSGTLRIDHDFSDSDKVYAVYNISNQNSHTSNVVNPYTGLGLTQNDRRNNTVSLSYAKVIRPNLVNEARGGFNWEDLLRHSNTTLSGFLSSIGFTQEDINAYGSVVGQSALSTYGHPAVTFGTGFANFTNGGRNTYRPMDTHLLTFGDTLTWILGRHTIKAGGDIVRNAAVDGFANNRGNPRGSIAYSGAGPNAFARFLLGEAPNSVTYVASLRPPMDVHNWEHGYFVQDDFRVSNRLTVNLGLRYELITPFVEGNDLLVNFDPNYVNSSTGAKGRFVIPSSRTLQYLDPRLVAYGVVTADKIGLGRGLVHPDTNNFAPRLGMAWRITDKTVLRGGYGFYYPTSAAQGIRDPIATNAFNQAVTKNNNNAASPLSGWPGFSHGFTPFTGGTRTVNNSQISANAVPFNLSQPRIQQYNATFERELGWRTSARLSYLGSYMSGLIAGRDLNALPASDNPFGTTTGDGSTICDPYNGDCDISPADAARRAFPALSDYLATYGNFGHGRSNAFQAQVDRRFSNGLMFSFSYTLLDQKTTSLDVGNSSLGGLAYNAFAPNLDYGTDSFVSRHRVVAYGVYDLPVGRSRRYGSSMNRFLDAIVGGWQTSFNMFAKSGTGFTPFWICDNCDPVYPGNVASGATDAVGDFNNVSFRPLVTGNPNVRSGDRIWNPSAFAVPTVGADLFSNSQVAKRNLLMGPGTWGLNFGVHKDFRFTERVRAQLGADINNLFNHPLFSPNQDYGGGGGPFALLGDFNVGVDQKTGKLLPITDVTPNPDFGRLITSFTQESIDSRRTVRLRLRITF